jgi:putative ABC transport system permease protein
LIDNRAVILDLRHALRVLMRYRMYTIAVVGSFVLGLGVNAGVATVAWSVLLRALPVRDAPRVVLVYPWSPARPTGRSPISLPTFREWRARNTVFDELAASEPLSIDLSRAGWDAVNAAVSDNFFRLLGVQPAEGRLLDSTDRFVRDGAISCVVSMPLARKMGGAASALHRRFDLPSPEMRGTRLTLQVVGVMPIGFERWRDQTDVWIVLDAPGLLDPQFLTSGYLMFDAIARLRSDIPVAAARLAIEDLDRAVESQLVGVNPGGGVRLVSLRDDVVPHAVQQTIWLFAVAAGLVFTMAVANAAGLVIARFEAQRQEIAVRRALGATARDVLRHVVTETALLGGLSVALSVPLAYATLSALDAFRPEGIAGQAVRMGLPVITWTLGLTVVAILCVAGVQQLMVRAVDADAATQHSLGRVRGADRSLNALVACEVALAIVVLVPGGLLVRNFVGLVLADPGFKPNGVLVVSAEMEATDRPNEPSTARDRPITSPMFSLLERVSRVPGVSVAAAGQGVPLDGITRRVSIRRDDGILFLNGAPDAVAKAPQFTAVSPRYFAALGIPMRAGREFRENDDESQPLVVIVNEAMARLHWPGDSPLGKRVKYGNFRSTAPWAEVVGVVGDVRSASPREAGGPQLYAPLAQQPGVRGRLRLLVRTHESAVRATTSARAVLAAVDRPWKVVRMEPYPDIVANSRREEQYQAELATTFGCLSLVLASLGVYGVVNYDVTRRLREIAIRVALGAAASDVASLVFGRGAVFVATGVIAGLTLTAGLTRTMGTLLSGVGVIDGPVFVAIPISFAAVAATAAYVPIRRALRLDVARALRDE